MDRPPSLVHPWLTSGLQRRLSSTCLSASTFRHSNTPKKNDTLPLIARLQFHCCCRADVLFGIRCAIGRNLANIHASCRAVAQNATYRDFGTTHIPATLTFGSETGSACAWTSIDYGVAEHVDKYTYNDPARLTSVLCMRVVFNIGRRQIVQLTPPHSTSCMSKS